jgi:hypothetical protein
MAPPGEPTGYVDPTMAAGGVRDAVYLPRGVLFRKVRPMLNLAEGYYQLRGVLLRLSAQNEARPVPGFIFFQCIEFGEIVRN